MGALLAFEWVRELRRNGSTMPNWLFLSGRRAPQTETTSAPLRFLPDLAFLSELNQRYRGIPEEILNNSDLLEFYLPILRADISVIETCRYKDEEPLNVPITVFAGVEDDSVSWNELLNWKSQTCGRFTAQLLPGGHFFPHGPLLQTLSTTIRELNLLREE